MAINSSDILSKLKRKMGISYMKLPVPDDDIMKCIYEDTLKDFSIYYPNYFTTKVNMQNDKVPGVKSTYFIKDEAMFGDELEIVGVHDVRIVEGMIYNPIYPMNMQSLMSMQMTKDMDSMMHLPITWEFISPNKIRIDIENCYTQELYVELMITHAKNFNTIPLGYFVNFYKLAELDAKSFLYPIMKHFDKIETTFGTIDLKIDDWADAPGKRDDLIADWQQKFINNAKKKIWVV